MDSCIDKLTNKEQLNKFAESFGEVGGLATLRVAGQKWPGNEWDRATYKVESVYCDGSVGRVVISYLSETEQNSGLQAFKEYVLAEKDRTFTVTLKFRNNSDLAGLFSGFTTLLQPKTLFCPG